MHRYITLIWCLWMSIAGFVHAQPQCTVTHYDEFSGMAQWYVTQIVQDRQGMMWFATWNGLNRYDGYEFQCFKSRTGDGVDIPSDRIQDMILADDGNLRCFVEGRVFGFSTKTCKFFQLPKEDERQLKLKFDTAHQREEAFEHSGTPNYYKDVYGTEWVVGQQGSLAYKHHVTRQYVDCPSDWHGAKRIRFCTADKGGNAWFTSDYGIFKLSFRRKPYTYFEQQGTVQVRCFYLDGKQRYWLTTRDDATIQLYDKDNHLLGYLDRDGQLHPQYVSFGSPVYHILQDTKGSYWLCSKPDGLFRLRETSDNTFSVEQFTHSDLDTGSLSNDELYYSIEDQQGRLWIATFNGGINCVENPQAEHPRFRHSGNGLHYPENEGQRVRQFHITQGHVLFAATTTGLFVADISPKDISQIEFKHHTKDIHRTNSLSNNATMYIAEDSRHRIYICTESGGVNQLQTEDLLAERLEFRHYNLSTGFPSDIALSAMPYKDDMIVVSNNQIVRFRPDESGSQNYESFFWHDRLRFSDATPTRLPDGRYIFGLQNGAFTLNPEDILKSSFVPPIAFTKLSIENGDANRSADRLDTLVLSPAQRNIFLQFAALDYKTDGGISYAFRLKHDDEPWNNIGRDHSVTFLDLKPGTYQLQVRSTNSDGVWVDNVRTLTIIVQPTFWETPWAQLMYLCILLLIVWAILYTRRYIIGLKRRQKELHEAYLDLLNANAPSPTAIPVTKSSPAKPEIKPEDEAFMKRAMKFIEEHLGDADINIGDMADATATSRSGLNRKMKLLLGVTPLDFIREARIRKACQLLKQGLAVNDVAYSCGFSDPKYFAKCFKVEIGMTPKEYKVENSAN